MGAYYIPGPLWEPERYPESHFHRAVKKKAEKDAKNYFKNLEEYKEVKK